MGFRYVKDELSLKGACGWCRLVMTGDCGIDAENVNEARRVSETGRDCLGTPGTTKFFKNVDWNLFGLVARGAQISEVNALGSLDLIRYGMWFRDAMRFDLMWCWFSNIDFETW